MCWYYRHGEDSITGKQPRANCHGRYSSMLQASISLFQLLSSINFYKVRCILLETIFIFYIFAFVTVIYLFQRGFHPKDITVFFIST